jgi:hypothetical protein
VQIRPDHASVYLAVYRLTVHHSNEELIAGENGTNSRFGIACFWRLGCLTASLGNHPDWHEGDEAVFSLGRQDPALEALRVVQLTLQSTGDGNAMVEALGTLVKGQHWQKRFASFSEFVLAPTPAGLGVRTLKGLKLLRYALLSGGHIAEWTEVLERTTRKQGRPKAKLVSDENSRLTYVVTTASTGHDRILLRLKSKHPEIYTAVCKSMCEIREGGIQAGLIKRSSPRYGGALDLERISTLGNRAQAKALCAVFSRCSRDAQCTLIARHLEPHLGTDLARTWRAWPDGAKHS